MKPQYKQLSYGLLLALVIGVIAPLQAAKYTKPSPSQLSLHYDVYAGGFKALNATMDMDLRKKSYTMKLQAETQGFIGGLFPWKGSYLTVGQTNNGKLIPTNYTEHSTWRKGLKKTEVTYDTNGKVLKTVVENKGKTTVEKDINEVLSHKTVDVLTGALVMFQSVKKTHQCEGSFPIFDGKRRFDITLKDDGKDILPPSRYSTFSGPALRCTLKIKPVAGFNKKDQKRGWMAVQNHTEAHHKLPTLWLAHIDQGPHIVPVRMEIASDYGTVVAHLYNAPKP